FGTGRGAESAGGQAAAPGARGAAGGRRPPVGRRRPPESAMRRRLRPGLPLRMQVTLLVLAVTLPAAAFVAHTAWRDRALMLAEAARAPEQLAAAAAAAQAQTVGAVLRLLEGLAAAPVLQTANREPCAALLDGAARLEPRIREIAALGEAGTIR